MCRNGNPYGEGNVYERIGNALEVRVRYIG